MKKILNQGLSTLIYKRWIVTQLGLKSQPVAITLRESAVEHFNASQLNYLNSRHWDVFLEKFSKDIEHDDSFLPIVEYRVAIEVEIDNGRDATLFDLLFD